MKYVIKAAEMPKVVLAKGQKSSSLTEAGLADYGMSMTTTGMQTGDVVKFAEDYSVKNAIIAVQFNENSDARDIRVLVEKNGKPTYVSLGFFTRRDIENNPIHAVSEALVKCNNHKERLEILKGQTIVGTKDIDYEAYVFEGGVRKQTADGKYETTTKHTTFCAFAEDDAPAKKDGKKK